MPSPISPPRGPSFTSVLFSTIRHPRNLLQLWNWKSALLSTLLRGPIFLAATFRLGWHAAVSAVLTESMFCALTAGFYGAVTQSFRCAEPQWLTLLFLTLVLPAIFQVVEYLMHWLHGTPHLHSAEIASVLVSGVSALFNWYIMRRNTLLVGEEKTSLASDLRRLPGLIVGFVIALPRRWLRRHKTETFSCAI